ncbi:Na+/H+ antiporter [Rhizobium leguminosarum]|uniref:Na+/H+ antiporter n=1 Tax=Rhizobium leguminosarum TaxID=384 RepID=UPI003F96DFB7
MQGITIALALLAMVVVSGTVSRILPIAVPLPLIQIGLGMLVAAVTGRAVELDPSIFFLLFLPPLLFLDGWRIPKERLLHDKAVILELALGLVLFTVLGVGIFIHWMIPSMPLPVAFALAAILSPTDPIAVSAISARIPIPKRLMHILEGESLLNDASGLVCMRFAVAAAVTGAFSVGEAVATFLWLALGGIAIGVGLTWAVTRARDRVSRKLGEDTGSYILISLLIPFCASLAAEHFHCSGILAAVAAGITMSYVERRGRALAVTRVKTQSVWDTVQFAMNGMVFVLLGQQFPIIASSAANVARESGHGHPIWLISYVAAITAALVIMRLTWVWISLHFTLFRAARRGQTITTPSWRLVVATSFAGVRGAISLAGILTLPLALDDGTAFPARELAIFLAAGVIISSLVLASVFLPFLLKDLDLPPEPTPRQQEDEARIAAAEAAIKAIQTAQHRMGAGRSDGDFHPEVGARLMALYRERIDECSKTGDEAEQARKMEDIERVLRLSGIRAERDAIFELVRAQKLPEAAAATLVREIDLLEARLLSST